VTNLTLGCRSYSSPTSGCVRKAAPVSVRLQPVCDPVRHAASQAAIEPPLLGGSERVVERRDGVGCPRLSPPLIEYGRRGLSLGFRQRDFAAALVEALVDLGSERLPWGESAEGLTGAVEANTPRELFWRRPA
jgi:hypothetical protein